MRIFRFCVCYFCVLVFLFAATEVFALPAGDAVGSFFPEEELRIAIEAQDWGVFHFSSGDCFEGFEVDLARKVAESLGVSCVLVPLPWGEGEAGSITGILEKGLWPERVHLGFAGIAVTEERMQKVLFSDPYFVAGQAVLLPRNSGVVSSKQMQGMRVSFQSGTTGALAAEKISGIVPLPFTDWPQAFQALADGRAQAAIVDSPLAFQVLQKHEEYTILDVLLTREYYGAFFPKGTDPLLIERVNEVIQEEALDLRDRWIPCR